jgi:ABC-2 type transport system permease protein
MPPTLRWFAESQPFTHAIEAVRGLLMGTPAGGHVAATLVWSAAIAAGSYLWAIRRYNRL